MSSAKSSYKVAIVAPTCFYYQTDLFRELAVHPRIDLTVYFCSNEGLSARDVLEMYKVHQHWGDEHLLEGYRSKFLTNYAPQPSYLKWPFGLINFGILKEIILGRPDVVILMSWMNPTWWIALAASVMFRIPFFYMTDANVQIEPLRSKWKRRIKQFFLGKILFKLSSGFLCAGTANHHFYRLYGVPEKKLFPFAYSWGYESMLKKSVELTPQRNQIRAELGFSEEELVILYCGRLSAEKNLFNLIEAYHRLDCQKKALVFVGDGNLREPLQILVDKLGAHSVHFLGFKDRNQIGKYYAMSDVFILPSVRETWGIAVNEAMCFGLPVIVSQQVGAGIDLVDDGQNGYSVGTQTENIAKGIQQISMLSKEEITLMGERSKSTIEKWMRRDLAELLVQYVESIQNKTPADEASDSTLE